MLLIWHDAWGPKITNTTKKNKQKHLVAHTKQNCNNILNINWLNNDRLRIKYHALYVPLTCPLWTLIYNLYMNDEMYYYVIVELFMY